MILKATNTVQSLLQERRALIKEYMAEKGAVARAMLQYEIESIDRALLNRGYR